MVDMPFTSAYRPNLALEILRSCLKKNGYACDIRYAKLEYASQIGLEQYTWIAEKLPHRFLVGDFLFGALLDDYSSDADAVENFRKSYNSHDLDRCLATSLAKLCSFRHVATNFLRTLAKKILEDDYDLVGFSLSFQLTPALALSRLIKRSLSSPFTVAGGNACEGEPGITIHKSFPWIDFVARGEGEQLIVDLAVSLSDSHSECSLGSIPGLIWRCGDTTVVNGERAIVLRHFDTYPSPVLNDWLDQLNSSGIGIQSSKCIATIETSRGCWFGEKSHCIF